MKWIDCKSYAQNILDRVRDIPDKKALEIITVGNDYASQSYVRGKIKDCEYCGIPYHHVKEENTYSTKVFLDYEIGKANSDDTIAGVIIQLPLPAGLDEKYFTNQVRFDKDVDGFKPNSLFKPCTPEGIMYVLHKEIGDLTGKSALVIGRGKLVGQPIVKMLLDEDCTVTIAHSKTTNLDELLSTHEIIVCAAGKAGLVDLTKCSNAVVVVDCGINRDANGKLVGDCFNFSESANANLKVTPVPGGVGLMTRAMLMTHVAGLDVNSI